MNEASTQANLVFDGFLESYRPHVRSEDFLAKMIRGLDLDPQFFAEFKTLKPFLATDKGDWSEDVVSYLTRSGALKDTFGHADRSVMQSLYRAHNLVFRAGRFDEEYLASIEDLALFFAFHDVKTIYLAGAYRHLTCRLIELICDRALLNRRTPIRHLMRALTSALTVELNQIQRVFTMYERYVSDSLVKDLSYGGMLTNMPLGRMPAAADPAANLGAEPGAEPGADAESEAPEDEKPWRKAKSVHAMIDNET